MVQPEGFHVGGPDMVCKLRKALPGLRQASRAWYYELHQALIDIGFRRSEYDHSIYVREDAESRQLLSVYVDDEIIAANNLKALEWTKKKLGERFPFKDQGDVKWILRHE